MGDKMPVKNFEFVSLETKRYAAINERASNVRIDTNSTVTLITAQGGNSASVEFRFTANYTGLGLIKIEGKIAYETENASGLSQEWQSTGKMPDAVANELHNAIMSNCIPEAVILARDTRLPPPIPLPKVNVGKGTPGKQHSSGMEVA